MRRLTGRGSPAPAAVVARAGLRPGERALASASTRDGTWLIGTREALLLVPPADDLRSPAVARLPWERVESADWDRDQERLRVTEVAEFGQVRPVHELSVAEPRRLLQLVRERVTASVLLQRRVLVDGARGLRVIARRAPAGRDEVIWACELDPGLDPDDPVVRLEVEAALRAAQDELGPGADPV